MTPILPQELPKHWEFVKSGLEEVIAKTNEQWTPTHVRQGINEGWAHLYLEDDGFAVLQRDKEEWTSEPYVNVWVMWFRPNAGIARRQELIAWLDSVARDAGCRLWKFGSPRGGWRAMESGCEIERIIWRRKT